jgi:hypothetical protein
MTTDEEIIKKKKRNFIIIGVVIGVAVLSLKVFGDYKMNQMKINR